MQNEKGRRHLKRYTFAGANLVFARLRSKDNVALKMLASIS